MRVVFGSGDAGDLCASLPIIRHLGGGQLVIGPHVGTHWPREPMTETRANFILPLIKAQPYITSAYFAPKSAQVITHDLSMFRMARYQKFELLTHWQARYLKLPPRKIDLSPWITVEPSLETKGRVVIARSPRYHNPRFQWRRVLLKHGERSLFVGLPDEYDLFRQSHGTICYRPVKDALEMAQLIAGSDLFIGNQSLPCWLAMSMGKQLIQESCLSCANSMVKRPNARFVLNQF